MMAWTDHHLRQMLRSLTRHTLLYTEMYPVEVLLAATPAALSRLLTFDPAQHPIAVQLGGRDPVRMGLAARLCASFGYDEVNINVGCPSDTVCGNGYGACLMREEDRVQQLAAAVRASVPSHVEVTVKHRLGVDEHDSWEELVNFVNVVSAPPANVRRFIVPARKAILGLSTADNREVPPLRYDTVLALCSAFPHLDFELNGQVSTLAQAKALLRGGDLRGCMIGRAAFHSPWRLADADRVLCDADTNPGLSRREVVARYSAYAELVWAKTKPELESEVCEEAGERETAHAVQARLRPRLRALRERLYQPLQHLFSDDGATGEEYERRLLQALERHMPIAKGAAHAMRCVPAELVDAVCAGCKTSDELEPGLEVLGG